MKTIYELLEFVAFCDFDPVEDDDNLVETAYRHGDCGSIDCFDTLDDALNELKKYEPTVESVVRNGIKRHEVHSYAVQEVFDDDGVYSEGELYYGYC